MDNNLKIVKKYFQDKSFVEANIRSFDRFIEKDMKEIIKEVGDIIPTIIPTDVEEFKIKFDNLLITKPWLIEADGAKIDVLPNEARMRELTYSSPIYVDVSSIIDGMQAENFTTLLGKIPIMIKSKYCHLSGMKEEQLIENGEDPKDPGGYFILNGNERVLVMIEDLASNRFFVEKQSVGPSAYTGKLFSERRSLRIPHLVEQMKGGIIYLSFTRFKRIPIIAVIKALGLTKDQEITRFINEDRQYDDVFINLYNLVDVKTQDDALEYLSRQGGITLPKEVRIERTKDQLDRYLLPHLGVTPEARIMKAYNLCKLVKKFLMVAREGYSNEDKDHYINKRIKLSGDLLGDLVTINLRVLVNDMMYNFQRLVKRGKFQSIKIIIREKLLTSRIKSAMATGSWPGGRQGVSQNMERTNFLSTNSHLQRVVSLLSTSQENFEARALHCTHIGRLCPIETPEGTPIGLRKNLAMLSSITHEDYNEEAVKKVLANLGVRLA